MKEISLIYNNLSHEYYLDFGRNAKQRNNLGQITEDKVVNELKRRVDFHRKTILYLNREISVPLAKNISVLFEGTKINVEIKKTR